IFYGTSARAPKYMAGFPDSLVPNWINSGDVSKLNSYAFDTAKADALMKDAGYAKGADGIYAKGGKALAFELYFPSDFQDWAAAATYASDALNKFGIKITPRGAIRSTQLPDMNNGNFQIGMNPWGIGNPHPQASLVRPFREFNKDATGGGMKYPLTQTYSGGTITSTRCSTMRSRGTTRPSRRTPSPSFRSRSTSCSRSSRSTNDSTTTLSTRRRASPAGSPKATRSTSRAAQTTSRSS